MAKPLTFIVIVLQIGGLVLLSALLVTPAQRHPIVNGIVVLSIAHCVIGILPALLYLSNSGFRIASKEHFQYDEGWARLCATDSVLLNYVTTAKSAFAISFTMPCVYLACKFTGNRDRLEAQATPHFYKRTVIALCVGPYIWALPLIFLTIHKLQQPLSMQPHFIGSICVVVYNTGQILALLLTLIPLTLAVVASIVLAFILFKYYKLPHLRQSFMLLHPIRIVRFASLVATIVVSAVLYAIVLATWVRYDSVHDLKSETAFRAWLKTSAVWEYKACCNRRPSCIFAWLFNHRGHTDDGEADHYDSAIVLNKPHATEGWPEPTGGNRPPRAIARQIMHISYAPFSTPSHDLRGLPPPPRHQRSRSHSSREPAVFRAVPSLSALGPKRRATSESRRQPSPSPLFDQQVLPAQAKLEPEDRLAKGLRLTPSDGERSKGEASSCVEGIITQTSASSSGSAVQLSRPASVAGGVVPETLDLTGTFGVVSPDP
ncbi:uncharacterized protein C8Q71DRAFT_857711 [Rhodofomes roseus]|uniref:G-protein coupled receptors family 1 profile domain-containing protein n=1 Tax=Rhodofomes roseus TaxID=34475 RepID=A0ABQ8KFA5_9APHY|nr:uncharacterized protein C8Q71DRAFT_857711 [Rhodofomes roseus]KAH9836471.1 hypothetical protein C8Q71DRAFT_857711 [Rhodofomes roseus]